MITKRLYKGTLTDSNATLYTAPSSTGNYTVIKTLTVCNKSASDAVVTISIAGTYLLYQQPITAKKTLLLIDLDHVLQAEELIEGLASADTTMDVYISGKEIT
jgi:hypothetical protein